MSNEFSHPHKISLSKISYGYLLSEHSLSSISFVSSFVCLSVPFFVCLCVVGLFVRLFVRSLACSFVRLLVCVFVRVCGGCGKP